MRRGKKWTGARRGGEDIRRIKERQEERKKRRRDNTRRGMELSGREQISERGEGDEIQGQHRGGKRKRAMEG